MASKRIKRSPRMPAQESLSRESKAVQANILKVVSKQLLDNDPPETEQAYNRLLTEGYSEQTARLLIGNLVIREIHAMIGEGRVWDRAGSAAALARLPELPD
ncbi:MAG: hypothetical protein KF753_09285 [Caldilineaceae bacterium]|nr:hypothetical protein [Caldilineaceae bacterium]